MNIFLPHSLNWGVTRCACFIALLHLDFLLMRHHCNSLSETVEVVKPINLKVDKFHDFEHIYFVGIIRMSFHILGFSFWKLSEIFITNLILISVIGKHFKDRLVKSKIFLP